MKIYIELTDWFKRFTGGKALIEVDINQGTTAIEAICSSGIPRDEIGFITINNRKVDEGFIPEEGARIKVYPIIIGG